jgi:ribose 5-phosphate isomerase A
MDKNEIKALVGKTAVETLVKSGMKLGLGTGSTALPAVQHLGLLLKEGTLKNIKAVSTSFQTSMECEKWGIPLYTLNSAEIDGRLDLTIDGADEVDKTRWCTKGGGGALLVEKITAYASASFCVVVDESKTVENLGLTFPVPLEVVPEARRTVTLALEKLGAAVRLREALRKAGPVITEHGNILLDLTFESPVNCADLEIEFNRIPGVVENGFFTRIRPVVLVGHSNGTVETKP